MYNKVNFDYLSFADKLGYSESRNNYTIVNRIGALGRYQFMTTTISRVAIMAGLPVKLGQDFLNDHTYQDMIYRSYVNIIIDYINLNNLDIYINDFVTGQKNNLTEQIDIYGMVAGAWLGGEGGLYNILVNQIDKNDNPQNPDQGTWISDYIAKFSSYEIGKKKIT